MVQGRTGLTSAQPRLANQAVPFPLGLEPNLVVPRSCRPEPLGQLGINSSIDKYFPFNSRTDERFAVDSFDFLQKSATPRLPLLSPKPRLSNVIRRCGSLPETFLDPTTTP